MDDHPTSAASPRICMQDVQPVSGVVVRYIAYRLISYRQEDGSIVQASQRQPCWFCGMLVHREVPVFKLCSASGFESVRRVGKVGEGREVTI